MWFGKAFSRQAHHTNLQAQGQRTSCNVFSMSLRFKTGIKCTAGGSNETGWAEPELHVYRRTTNARAHAPGYSSLRYVTTDRETYVMIIKVEVGKWGSSKWHTGDCLYHGSENLIYVRSAAAGFALPTRGYHYQTHWSGLVDVAGAVLSSKLGHTLMHKYTRRDIKHAWLT